MKGTVKLVSWLVAAKIGGRDCCIVVVQGPPLPGRRSSPTVWLYHRFPLSFREVEELMLQRGVVVSYEPSGPGVPSSGRPTPTSCAGGAPAPAISGTWMRCL